MTNSEWQLINTLASQLQHFYDRDGKQYAEQVLADLLNRTEEVLNQTRTTPIELGEWADEQTGKVYFVTEEQVRSLQVLVWGARFTMANEPENFNRLIETIRNQRR